MHTHTHTEADVLPQKTGLDFTVQVSLWKPQTNRDGQKKEFQRTCKKLWKETSDTGAERSCRMITPLHTLCSDAAALHSSLGPILIKNTVGSGSALKWPLTGCHGGQAEELQILLKSHLFKVHPEARHWENQNRVLHPLSCVLSYEPLSRHYGQHTQSIMCRV